MLILERPINKEHWQAVQEFIMHRMETVETKKIDGVTAIYATPSCRAYALFADDLPVSWLYLIRKPNWAAWEVKQVFTYPDLQGHGLATRIYKAAVNGDNIILASGKTQAKASRALWAGLIRKNVFNIWAQDFKNLDQRSQVWWDDDEVQCNMEIYTRDPVPADVRFVAIRKRPNGLRPST